MARPFDPLSDEERQAQLLKARPRMLPVAPHAAAGAPQAAARRRGARRRSAMAPHLRGVGDHAQVRSGLPALRLARRSCAAGRAQHRGVSRSRAPDGRARSQRGDRHRRRGVPPRRLDRDRARHPRSRNVGHHDHRRSRHHRRASEDRAPCGARERERFDRWARSHARSAARCAGLVPRGARCLAPLSRGGRASRLQHADQPLVSAPAPRVARDDRRAPACTAGRFN